MRDKRRNQMGKKGSAEDTVKTIRRKTHKNLMQKSRSASSLRVCGAKKRWRICAVGKGSPKACITSGAKSF